MAATGNWKDNISAHISLTTLCNTSFPMFFDVRNTFLKSFLGFNYICRVILPFDMVVFLSYTVSQKRETLDFCPYLCQIWNDFHNYFTSTFSMKFAIKWLPNISPHRKYVATLPCEILIPKNCCIIEKYREGEMTMMIPGIDEVLLQCNTILSLLSLY